MAGVTQRSRVRLRGMQLGQRRAQQGKARRARGGADSNGREDAVQHSLSGFDNIGRVEHSRERRNVILPLVPA